MSTSTAAETLIFPVQPTCPALWKVWAASPCHPMQALQGTRASSFPGLSAICRYGLCPWQGCSHPVSTAGRCGCFVHRPLGRFANMPVASSCFLSDEMVGTYHEHEICKSIRLPQAESHEIDNKWRNAASPSRSAMIPATPSGKLTTCWTWEQTASCWFLLAAAPSPDPHPPFPRIPASPVIWPFSDGGITPDGTKPGKLDRGLDKGRQRGFGGRRKHSASCCALCAACCR